MTMAQIAQLKQEEIDLIPMIIKIISKGTEKHPLLSDRIVTFMNNKVMSKNKMSGVRLRKITNYIRVNGISPIISNSNGYYISYDREDIIKMKQSLRSRINAMIAAEEGLNNILKQMDLNPEMETKKDDLWEMLN